MSEPGSIIRTLAGRPVARNFHTYVLNEVGRAIVSGEIGVGSILPGDGEMMEQFGVSRTVLREALKTLEAKGLVEARAKVGTRVLPRSRWSFFDRQVLGWVLESGPSDSFMTGFRLVRRGLEVDAARLAAMHRDAEHIRLMNYWLNQREKMAQQPEPFALAEFEFHRVLAEASANPFLRSATALVEFGIAMQVSARLGPEGEAPPEGLAQAGSELYARLIAAVERSQPDEAAAIMAARLETD